MQPSVSGSGALNTVWVHFILIDCTEVLETACCIALACLLLVQYFHQGAKWCAGGLVISAQVTKGPTIPPNLCLYFRPSKKLKLKLIISVEVNNECKKENKIRQFLKEQQFKSIRDQKWFIHGINFQMIDARLAPWLARNDEKRKVWLKRFQSKTRCSWGWYRHVLREKRRKEESIVVAAEQVLLSLDHPSTRQQRRMQTNKS